MLESIGPSKLTIAQDMPNGETSNEMNSQNVDISGSPDGKGFWTWFPLLGQGNKSRGQHAFVRAQRAFEAPFIVHLTEDKENTDCSNTSFHFSCYDALDFLTNNSKDVAETPL